MEVFSGLLGLFAVLLGLVIVVLTILLIVKQFGMYSDINKINKLLNELLDIKRKGDL